MKQKSPEHIRHKLAQEGCFQGEFNGGCSIALKSVSKHYRSGKEDNNRNNKNNRRNLKAPGYHDSVIVSFRHLLNNNFPIIDDFASGIMRLFVDEHSQLTIAKNGMLIIDCFDKKAYGIRNRGHIHIDQGAELHVIKSRIANILNYGIINNKGDLVLDKNNKPHIINREKGTFTNKGSLSLL